MTLRNRLKARLLPAALAALLGSWRRGQPVPAALREHAIHLRASGIGSKAIAGLIGVTPEAVRLWVRAARAAGAVLDTGSRAATSGVDVDQAVTAPTKQASPQRDPPPRENAHGLSEHEVAAILTLKKQHPSMGPAQIRAQLERFKGWRVSVRAIARVLRKHGYELVHIGSRPKDEVAHRFEAPYRNALWQMDFVEPRVGPEKVYLLVMLDDFSRFVVGWGILPEPTSEAVVAVLREAIRRHGKPEAVYTDRGGAFLAWRNASDFETFLEAELIDHHVGSSYHPQGRGKVEALAGTIQRELWNVVHFEEIDQARERPRGFFRAYNEERARMGIDGLTPADRSHGRWEEVKATVEAAYRRRQGASLNDSGSCVIEEMSRPEGPVEILRLIVLEGRLQLRFLGHRVDQGARETFVNSYRRHALEDIQTAERHLGDYACRCQAHRCDRYFAAILRRVAEENTARGTREREQAIERRKRDEEMRIYLAERELPRQCPEARVAHGLDFWGVRWVSERKEFVVGGRGPGRGRPGGDQGAGVEPRPRARHQCR